MRILQEVAIQWKRNFSLQITGVVTIGLCFTTVLVLGLIAKNMESSFSSWGDKIEMSIYLNEDVDGSEISKIENSLRKFDFVKSYSLLDKASAKKNFLERFGDLLPSINLSEEDNPFPSSFELEISSIPASMFSLKYLEGLKDKLMELNGVEEVGYGQYWFESYAGLIRGIRSSVFIVAIILSLASFLIIANSIRAMIFKKKREVEILELIGATPNWIRAPFVLNGVITGCLASLMAILGSYFMHALIVSKFTPLFRSLGVHSQIAYFTAIESVIILLVGALVGALGSYLCIRQMNSGWSALDSKEF